MEPDLAGYKPSSYMNGGVNTIVGGELVKAALQHGYEAYRVDILRRILTLINQHNGDLPVAYRPEGQVGKGIPDNWVQAAFMGALIEGLAELIDQSASFDSVELSPRWLVAGKNSVNHTASYGPSGKALHYQFRHESARRQLSLTCWGDPRHYVVRMLLPKNRAVRRILIDGKPGKNTIEHVSESRYAVIDQLPEGRHLAEITYR